MSTFVGVYQKLWYASKPSVAAVQGWCLCGGTDLVLWADLIVAADSAVFGYPASRVWGVPTAPMWVYRIGFREAVRRRDDPFGDYGSRPKDGAEE